MLVLNTILKWGGFATVVAGALCTSLRIDPLNIYFLNVGAVLYMLWAYRAKDWNIAICNAVLLALYVVGLFYTKG
jgi:hypothetical protein